jgi:hypothetical protein
MAIQDLEVTDSATSKKTQPKDQSRFSKYAATIDSLDITDIQREFLKNRWFDQVNWMSNEAAKSRKCYERLRSIVIIGSALVPTLVTLGTLAPTFISLNSQEISFARSGGTSAMLLSSEAVSGTESIDRSERASSQLQTLPTPSTNPSIVDLSSIPFPVIASLAALLVSQGVAICAAIDQFYKYGDRWRHYRRSVELLKSDGWQFFQLIGSYAIYADKGNHKAAFALFANQVESIIRSDVEGYISQIASPKQPSTKDKDGSEQS